MEPCLTSSEVDEWNVFEINEVIQDKLKSCERVRENDIFHTDVLSRRLTNATEGELSHPSINLSSPIP